MLNRTVVTLSAVLVFWCLSSLARAQGPTSWEPNALRTEIYFGSDMGGGQAVSQQAWQEFLDTIIAPRFPAGLTVVEAFGRSMRTEGGLTPTRILIAVHPADDDSDARLNEIKAEYKKRFMSAGVFHVDAPIRIQND